jgi:hypothetical protein
LGHCGNRRNTFGPKDVPTTFSTESPPIGPLALQSTSPRFARTVSGRPRRQKNWDISETGKVIKVIIGTLSILSDHLERLAKSARGQKFSLILGAKFRIVYDWNCTCEHQRKSGEWRVARRSFGKRSAKIGMLRGEVVSPDTTPVIRCVTGVKTAYEQPPTAVTAV